MANALLKKNIFNKLLIKLFPNQLNKLINIPDQNSPILKTEIPNIVYQTWVSRNLPLTLGKEIKKFRALNKDFSFKIFTDEERDEYMAKSWVSSPIYKIYLNSIFQACKSDIFRYCLIYEKGGFYFDIKSGCNKPLSSLKVSNGGIISYEASSLSYPPDKEIINNLKYPFNIIKNWSFAFSPNHPFLKLIIENIIEYAPYFKGRIFRDPKNAILLFTGPGMMTKVFHQFVTKDFDIIIPNGIDYDGHGIYELNGADFRFKQSSSYSLARNCSILTKF